MYKRQTYGFTFIELLVSATIIIVLSVIGVVSFAKAGKSARDARRRADLAMVQQAMVQYKVNEGTGEYPDPTGANAKEKFADLIPTLQTAGYLSAGTIQDPKNDLTYYYAFACTLCAGTDFTVSATPEVTGAPAITFSNP